MSTKYIQIGYSLPTSNDSVYFIQESETPINEIVGHFHLEGPLQGAGANSVYSWVLTSDKSIEDLEQGYGDKINNLREIFDASIISSNNDVRQSERALFNAAIDNCSIVNTTDDYTGFKWYEAKLTIADDYSGDLTGDILENYSIDGSGNLSFTITGVTVETGSSMDYDNYTSVE